MQRLETIDREQLYHLFRGQTKSCDLWIAGWNRVKDSPNPSIPLVVPHVRNVSLAIGKLMGIYNVICYMNAMEEDVPDDILQGMLKYQAIWDQF